ncbi:MAG: hypothetical protein HY726_03755 [Candidatus Rokubacteria bacterium]|nr:hypothetical protein [Candidatus Rokubacteria bacterium]
MRRLVQARRILRLLYRSGRLAKLTPPELRLLLLMLSAMSRVRGRRWRPTALRQALGLSTAALNQAAMGLERRGWLRIVRTTRTWVIELKGIKPKR